MKPIPAIRHALANATRTKGRAPRSEFWWFMAFNLALGMLAGAVDGPLPAPGEPAGMRWANAVVTVALLVPNATVFGRRLHDVGLSARWLLAIPLCVAVGILTAILGGAFPALQPLAQSGMAAVNLTLPISIGALLVTASVRGTRGTNAYGPDPLATQDFGVPPRFAFRR